MQQNSFQKNGLLNMKNINHDSSFIQDPKKLGRRTIEDIKNDMLKVKHSKLNNESHSLGTNNSDNNQISMRQRMDYLKRIDNMNRWK